MRIGLRLRLLLAFVLVAVPPVAALALLVGVRLSRAYEETATTRLRGALDTTRERIARLEARAEARIAAIATLDLPAAANQDDPALAETLGARHDLAG